MPDPTPETVAAPAPSRQAARDKRHPFTRALLATVASTALPGLGLVTAETRRTRALGWTISGLVVAAGLAVIALGVFNLSALASLAVRPRALTAVSWTLAISGFLWVCIILGTHLVRRPRELTGTQRAVGAFAVAGLSFLVAAPMAVAARYATDQARLVTTVFKADGSKSETRPTLDTTKPDVWANKPRLNILLLGGDTTAERIATIKDRPILTDTIMVASIDTKTGSMVLVQIPRNMAKTPFPAGTKLHTYYPRGFQGGPGADPAEYFANAIWNNVPKSHPDALPNTDYPGADAMKLGIGEAIGLPIDYFVLLNIDGLQALIDAMGGVTVNINERLPIAGNSERPQDTMGWLEPGPNQHLDGYRAMWYARSRWSTDDFSRMSRQSCLVNAIVRQADPVTMLTRYEAIAQASSQMVETDIPQSVLPAIVDVALRTKAGAAKRVLFQHGIDGYDTTNPNFDMMRSRVEAALRPTPSASASPSSDTTTKAPTTSSGTKKPSQSASSPPKTTQNIEDVCAYNPVKPK